MSKNEFGLLINLKPSSKVGWYDRFRLRAIKNNRIMAKESEDPELYLSSAAKWTISLGRDFLGLSDNQMRQMAEERLVSGAVAGDVSQILNNVIKYLG